ncbi:hypothetical protein KKF38_00360, partial [Patescibacteria group bacterium]|nr:hypothetical protein [Patescibacteria group bacterium]
MNKELKDKSRTQQRIITGIVIGIAIISLAIFGRISGEKLAAAVDVDLGGTFDKVLDGIGLKDVGLDIQTEDFGLSIGNTGNQPGCGGSNCLAAPDASEYSGLAGESSLRQALITWTNFFLNFLALIAMIALIYAG